MFTAVDHRPMTWLDDKVNTILAQSTVLESESSRNISRAAGTMARSKANPQPSFAKNLIEHWQKAAVESERLETIELCNLVAALRSTGGRELVAPMRDTLKTRAIGKDGWLAAFELWLMSSDEAESRSFPVEVDLRMLIAVADFSVASRRAARFFQGVGSQTELANAVYTHLFESFEGRLDWEIDSFLLGWLLHSAPKNEIAQRVSWIVHWLERHDDDTYARTRYLTFIQGLPPTSDEQRKQAAVDTAKWLRDHDDDTYVRTRYLTFIQNLPDGFDKERADAAQATSDWLNRHPNSQDVLGRYVSFLLDVPLDALEPLRQASDKHHRRLIEENPDDSHRNFVYAGQLLQLSRFEEAIAQYDVVLNRRKEHQMARRGRAFALQKLGRMPEAEEEFKRALGCARDQKRPEAIFHTSLGEFYLESSRWLDAISSFQQAQEERPGHFRVNWGIAKAHVGLGNLDKAEDFLQRALEYPNLESPAKDEILQLLEDVRHRRPS